MGHSTPTQPGSTCRRAISTVLACLTLLATTGCVHRGRDSVVHFWADYNTLGTCAFFVDKIHHQNLKSFTVDRFRWMYGLPPGGPLPHEAPCVTSVPVIQQGPYPPLAPAFEPENTLPGPILPPQPPAEQLPAEPAETGNRTYGPLEGPTARGPRAELAALERRSPAAANAARSGGATANSKSAETVIPPPKGSWLFARP